MALGIAGNLVAGSSVTRPDTETAAKIPRPAGFAPPGMRRLKGLLLPLLWMTLPGMRFLLLFLLLALPLPAAVFVPPEDTKPLFRRDLLPIDTDTMRALSSQLTALARRDPADNGLQLRATAQLLAIATRLDPTNRPARELGRRLAAGEAPLGPPNLDLNLALGRSWHIVDWLLEPEAGPEGRRLGQQLLDALRVLDPRHPHSKRHDADGEAARWSGIVAELSRFNDLPPADPPKPPTRNSDPPPPPAPPPEPPPPPVKRPPILMRQGSVRTPLYLYDQDFKQHLLIAPIAMDVLTSEDPGPLTFTLSPEFKSPLLDSAREKVRRSLERTWPNLPGRSLAVLESGGRRYASRNATAISGPASLLLHAALAGKTLRSDVVFVGDLHDDGALTRPRWSWDYLRALRKGEGGRLLVPPDLQAELRALIALESSGFYLKWEVLVVSSLDVALSLASVGGDPEGLAAASATFAEVRRVAEGKDVGQLCVNSHVRKRLGEIQGKAPFHSSASLLLLQGSGQRPNHVEREVAARILRSGVEPLAYLTRAPLSSLSPQRIDAAAASARSEIDRFAKFFDPRDAALHQEAVQLSGLARALARGKQIGKAGPQGNILIPPGVPLSSLQQQLQTRFSAYLRNLAPYTGESFPPTPPAAPRKNPKKS